VAYAARDLGIEARIVVPAAAVARKVDAIRALGATVISAAGGYAVAEAEGHRLAESLGAVWVSPYNDAAVIAGQGTLGLEIEAEWGPALRQGGAQVFVPVGGGGLAAGIGIALDAWRPRVRVMGVLPAHSAYLHAFFHHGSMQAVREDPTLADGLAGAIETDSITLELARTFVDDMLLVSEEEIRGALMWACRRGLVIEPSAAVALAGALRGDAPRKLAVLSGGNVDPVLWEDIRQHAQA
jgi:threonine dehydratase